MQFIFNEENGQTCNDLIQEGCKKLTVFIEFKKKVLHGIVDHLQLVITHHPASLQPNQLQYKKIRTWEGEKKFFEIRNKKSMFRCLSCVLSLKSRAVIKTKWEGSFHFWVQTSKRIIKSVVFNIRQCHSS